MENNQKQYQITKSITNLVSQFLNFACHELLYLLKIHDKEYFTSKRHGDVTVHVNRHREIQDYIAESVTKATELLSAGRLNAFLFVVVDVEKDEPIERYLFRTQMYRHKRATIRDAQEQLNDLLVKLSFEIGNDIPPSQNYRERTFRCLIYANPEAGTNDTILKNDTAWEQLAKTGYEIDQHKKEIIPLGGADTGLVDVRLELQENVNKK
jgi:hypothetical protein